VARRCKMCRHGVAGTSVADLRLAAGCSRSLPVERFGSKFWLVKAVSCPLPPLRGRRGTWGFASSPPASAGEKM